MNIREFIAVNNTDGVVKFAADNGIQIQNSPDAALHFLDAAYSQDPGAVMSKMGELHPHGKFMMNAMTFMGGGVSPQTSACSCAKCTSQRGKFKNFDDGTVEGATNTAIDIFNQGVDKGRETANNWLGQGYIKDHSKELLTYGAVLFAGIIIGRFFCNR